MLEAIKTRQSIRRFKNNPVENDKVQVLLEAAMNAPSARNTQEWQFVVITNRKVLDGITKLSPYTQMMKQAPLAILVLANLNKAISKKYALINCGAAIENMLIEANNLNLGACWCGIAPLEARINNFKQYFNLSDNEYPVGIVAIGYPDEKRPLINTFDPSKVRYLK